MRIHPFGAHPFFVPSSFTFQALGPEDCLALRGPSILSQTISIKHLLQQQQLEETAYGPLNGAGHAVTKEDDDLGLPFNATLHQQGVTHAATPDHEADHTAAHKATHKAAHKATHKATPPSPAMPAHSRGCSDPPHQAPATSPSPVELKPSQKKIRDKLRSARCRRWKKQALRAAGVTSQQERLLKQALYGPLTDSESDSDKNGPSTNPHATLCSQYPPVAPAILATADMPPSNKGKGYDKVRSARRRRKKRLALQAAGTSSSKGITKKRRAAAAKEVILIDYCLSTDARVSEPGWIGKRVQGLPCREFTKQELIEDYGMSCFGWDGRWGPLHPSIGCCSPSYDRGTHLLLDRDRSVGGVLVGQPKDFESWGVVQEDAFDGLQGAASRLSFSDKECCHRRGHYPSLPHGISFGGGQPVRASVFLSINPAKQHEQEPQHLRHRCKEREEELEALMNRPSIQRICKFASSTLKRPCPTEKV